MAIEFRCTGCEKLLRTGDHTGGLPAKCPECGTLQTIPQYGSELDIAPKSPPDPSDPDFQPSAASRNSSGEDTAAVMSLLLGVTALMTSCCLPLAFPVALIGLVLGVRAVASKNNLVLAVIGTAISLLGLLVTFGLTIAILFGF
ncbi:MAG: Com family DNA-binding transcriptional regulator [Planctomycetota bacterium]|nr:Com family DNA-binding transcriptional regulator [Planctomycetota bacterium]